MNSENFGIDLLEAVLIKQDEVGDVFAFEDDELESDETAIKLTRLKSIDYPEVSSK